MSGRIDHLFVQSTTEVGGAETVLQNLFAASAELRRRAAVVLLQFGQGALAARLRSLGARVFEQRAARLRDPLGVLSGVSALASLASRLGARTLVGNGAHPQVYGALAAQAAGARSVYFVHGPIYAPLSSNHPIDVLALRARCDRLIANSRETEATLARLALGPPVRRLTLGTAIEPVSPAEAAQARRALGAARGEVLVGVFGRLLHSKGQDALLHAVAALPGPVRRRVGVVVVGDTTFGREEAYGRELRELPARLGLGPQVRFLGFRSDVARWMAACDVVCQPSRLRESFGMALVEALAQGRAVIGTRTGGPEEIVEPGRTGLLVPPDDVTALTAALAALIEDAPMRRRMGRAGAVEARARFGREAMASALLAELDGLR